ncbi:putative kinase-(PK-like) protein [Rhizoctonia solani 123E]|uniref:ubiquitinyl hydrolase 1 n=1 Tax=Rhizoctonia solani 123E TaxID=1423351 RepID=A0A074RLV1_9AGAM|nr:putative kinase-(PK-like) protein [Rhizoctonia solani 123E]
MSAFSDSEVLQHLAYNVFLPPKLPQEEQQASLQQSVDLAIISSAIEAGQHYQFDTTATSQWAHMELMLRRLYGYIEFPLEKSGLYTDMMNMKPGDVLAFYIRAQNAGVIIRKQANHTTFEAFEVQAQTEDVMSISGKVTRHFPGPAVQLPNAVANDREFITEVANVLVQMDVELFDEAHPTTRKAGTNVRESRNSINPNYFIQYFFGFLRGMGTTVNPRRIVKRLADDVLWMDAKNPWRRSPIWLILRVALQTSFDSPTAYKHFMVYHHAYVLSRCNKDDSFSSDLLFAMRIKMARRLHKIKDSAPRYLIDAAEGAANGSQHLLQGRWAAIQLAQSEAPNRAFSATNFESAIHLTLPNSRHYLERVFQDRYSHTSPSKFVPNQSSRLENVKEFSQYANGALSRAFTNDPHLALFDFEASVFDNLASWTSDQMGYSGACTIMSSCFRQYLTAAKSYYTADIADRSIMILTLMRIWMAIDELATRDNPMLGYYSPELPADILDPLLLRTTQHIEQARLIQQYIRERHVNSSGTNPSIFSEKASANCFAVQYFKSSSHHQQLKVAIEVHAQEQKNRKIKELEELNARHERLGTEIQGKTHEYRTLQNGRQKHDRRCARCVLEKTRKGLQIQPYEWPLPRQQLDAEMVVFELDRPASYVVWRDTTYEILIDLGTPSPRGGSNQHAILDGYSPLGSWFKTRGSIMPRITLASSTKSFQQSHYSGIISIPASEYQVCLDNALQFKLYDKSGNAWASGPFLGVTFAQYGTFKLPTKSLYRHLEYTVGGTTHSSNQVLADQHDCPKELSLHEHIAFGTLRSGARLQWMNIVRGLEEDMLTFSTDEVRLLHTQAAWQIGPLMDQGSREWHEELDSSEFGRLLVCQCMRVLDRVKANWLQATSVSTIVTLVTRLLAASPTNDIAQPAYDFLRSARSITHKWLGQLKFKLQSAIEEEDVIGYQRRLCEMAAICRATYDVGPRHMEHLLASLDDFPPFIISSVCLYDNQPPDIEAAPTSLRVLMCRDHRFAHHAMPVILASLRRHDMLSSPLSEIWPDYQPGSTGWRIYSASNSRWVSTTTARTHGDRTQEVHLNILTGQLLIDGKPLGRLPRQYVEHPTYIRLFGQKILDVVPSKSPGMDFATRDYVHGYQVSFAFEGSSNQLIIQARKNNRHYELIPHEKLTVDFPLFFSEDFHHWADVRGKTVEFRRLSDAWSVDSSEWLLRFDSSRTLKNLANGSCLVDIHSPAFHSLTRSISPLECDRYVHVTRSVGASIEVELPRMKLSFFVNPDNQLESQNFRGQVLDENQSAGTLFGLKNQLLLRAKGTVAQSLPRSRSVLIPDGEIGFASHGNHVSVAIQFDSRRSVDVYRYKIDEDLGYLMTDAGLTSRLFKIYLHALTSHCLPDPLTGRTGTEEALHELSQASSSSFEQIDVKQAELLKAIGLLTPKREYYPEHLKCMQTTHWIGLPSLSQHFGFSFAATRILGRADILQLFHPLDFKLNDYISALGNSDILLKRAARRTAMYYPSDTAAHVSEILGSEASLDSVRPGRDNLSGDWVEAGQVARWASGLVYQNWGRPVFVPYDLVHLAQSWGTLDDSEENNPLTYQSSWFGLDLRSSWITFYNLLRRAKISNNKYMLSACLSSIAFGQVVPANLIPIFLAFAMNPEFQSLDPPSQRLFQFGDGYEPSRQRLEGFVSSAAYSVESTPARDLPQNDNESYYEFSNRKQSHHRTHSSTHQSQLVQYLMDQWPQTRERLSVQLNSPSTNHSQWINVETCLRSTREYFSSCVWNIKVKNHLQKLEGVLSSRPVSAGTTFVRIDDKLCQPPIVPPVLANPWSELSISSIMHSRNAPTATYASQLSKLAVSPTTGPASDTNCLAKLFTEFQGNGSLLNRRYGADLDESRKELDSKPSLSLPGQLPSSTTLEQTRGFCSTYRAETFQRLGSALAPQTDIERILLVSGIWPRITSRTILQQLSLRNRHLFDSLPGWWAGLVGYARVFVDYQRSHRLIALAESRNIEEFYKELDISRESDSGVDDADWFLVQIDGNFGARAVQCQVAREMISPSSGSNTVLQLNMGEGKSSVIVPIVASSLADSSRLVRVVVLKPLWRQMFELLVNRLSGLSNRRVYYLPFGRHINIDKISAQKLRNLYEECMREGGILLAQPEHILSFKLMGIDQLISSSSPGDIAVAKSLRDMQNWLKDHSRDILDESDEILHVRYQLVYTAGEQQPLDDHPDRWTTTQQLLHLAATHVKRLQQKHPDSLLYRKKEHGQFPTVRIMPDCPVEVEKKLISAIAVDVQDGRLLNLNCDRLHPSARNILFQFFTDDSLPYSSYELLKGGCDSAIWKGLLLIRGLLASGILAFALKCKHHRVDYGLDLNRTLLAVPYRAKDLPSLRAEFGHPDVAVVLTCLSYYYQGLTEQQLDLCFELLYKLDNPSLEYEQWVQRNNTTPDDLRQLNGVNIKDRQQFTERLVPTFSRNSGTVDFFLYSVVFPKEAKEFPEKLSTSGWDLAERKANVTTGFSGTNDNRYLLPTSISQADPVKQLSTNALVLTYLLQPENNFYLCMRDGDGNSLTTEGFLKLLVTQTPEVRVLLDVGAQMLELQNEELVRCWLGLRPEVEAAVYFNERDELVVLPRNGTPTLLSTSPFAQQLDKCIVYLDDGHTRGTDLKLPRETRALVTLGPKVTKDRLLQGCMRMRRLGHGQSVMFAAPPEIDTQIRNASPNPIKPGHPIEALDVLRWAMLETCKDLQHHVSHWAQQGIEYSKRHDAERSYEQTRNLSALKLGWTTPESRPLEEMYGVVSPEALRYKASFTQRAFGVSELRRGLENLGVIKLEDPSMDEEQEREVSHEIEREQQTQRPPKGQPANHSIHPDVKRYITTGVLPTGRSGILSLFYPFRASHPSLSESWSRLLFASADFLQTVSRSSTDRLSDYMRPVNWVLTGPGNIRVVLSPHEVNELLSLIRTSTAVRLHVYAPRVAFSMLCFSDLQFYSIPSSPSFTPPGGLSTAQLQLDIFAGQLYFSSYQDYTSLCASLGLYIATGDEDLTVEMGSDGFVKPQHRHKLIHRHAEYPESAFAITPIPALRDLIGRRRKGMRYFLTHVGKVLHGRTLTMEEF